MNFNEAVAAMKDGHAVRRDIWHGDHRMSMRPSGMVLDPQEWDFVLTVKDYEANDWRRVDRLDADTSDAYVDIANNGWMILQTIQNALDHPKTQVGCVLDAGFRDTAQHILRCFPKLKYSVRKYRETQMQIDMTWEGDKPRVVRPGGHRLPSAPPCNGSVVSGETQSLTVEHCSTEGGQ